LSPILTIAQETPMQLKDILQALIPQKKLKYLYIPWQLIWIGLKICELIGLKMRLKSDNLISLLNQNPTPNFKPLHTLNIKIHALNNKQRN
jgi:hypothetical protein